MKLKILFLSANPYLDLNLDEEYRSIDESINQGKYRDSIILLKPKLAVKIDDIIQAINTEKPHIIHFSGHGTEDGKLNIIDESGKADDLLSKEALFHLFETSNDNIKLVFLNACHSKTLAQTISNQIDYVIGMNDKIKNQTAIALATTFYKSFTNGKTISESFTQATKVKLSTEKYCDEQSIPELIVKNDTITISIKKFIFLHKSKPSTILLNKINNYYIKCNNFLSDLMTFGYIKQNALTLNNTLVVDILDKVLQYELNNSFLILGSSGTGKSTLAINYFLQLKEEKIKSTFIIYLDLKNIDFIENTYFLIYNSFLQQDIYLDEKEVRYLLENKKLFFILDGFDEIGCRDDIIKAEKSLKMIFNLKSKGYDFLLTCRVQYFKLIQSIQSIALIKKIDIFTLSYWTQEQIFEYIEKKDSNNAKKILNKIFSIYNLKDLSTTPLLLSMIIDNYNCIENKDNFTSSQLYDLYIKNWLLREDSNIFIPWTEKEDIIELLAWKMYINNVSKIHFKDIEKELMLKFKPNFLEKNYLSNSIRTKSLLTKDDKGYYFFQHRSFMEFIIAKVLLTALRENNLIIFGKKQMYHEVSIFIRGLICKDDFILLSSVLGNILSNEIARFHAANLLTTTFTVLINKKYIGNKLLIFLEKCLENEKSIMVTRQLVYLVCFIKGNKGAIKYLNRLKKNLYEDQLDTFYALNYFGKNLDDAIHGHLKHLKDIRYHKHLIMDLYHLGKIGRLKEIEEIEKFTQYHENIVIEYAKDAIQKIKEREYNE